MFSFACYILCGIWLSFAHPLKIMLIKFLKASSCSFRLSVTHSINVQLLSMQWASPHHELYFPCQQCRIITVISYYCNWFTRSNNYGSRLQNAHLCPRFHWNCFGLRRHNNCSRGELLMCLDEVVLIVAHLEIKLISITYEM